VGLIARTIEASGIPTVYLGSCRDMMALVRAPRSVFLDFPLGRQCGRPGQADLQKRILKDALAVLATAKVPGEMVRLDYEWDEHFDWDTYQADMKAMLEAEQAEMQEWKPKD